MEDPQISADEPSAEALFRFLVLSQVIAREHRGQKRSKAVKAAAETEHLTADNKMRKVSRRSIYRWLAAFEAQGFIGLLPALRPRVEDSTVLEPPLIDFFKTQKTADPETSVPELIRRAKLGGLIEPERQIHRVTVWRALNRMGIDTSRRKTLATLDSRRFSYPHRMQMVLCDGKHFRAGEARLRRVAFFYLDDCSRMGLHAVVGPSESSLLFLRGLFETILAYGLMDSIFVDNGSGFIAQDSIDVLRKLAILFIHGTAAYPEGRGKAERFNRTIFEQLLRLLDGNPEIDPSCAALELRLNHYLGRQYNMELHESLKNTPWSCFHDDVKPLRFPESEDRLRQAFVLHAKRRVSNDNVVSFDGLKYEVIRGHAGSQVTLHRNILDGTISIIHQGRLVRLSALDKHKNARAKRAKPGSKNEKDPKPLPPKSSAQMAFDLDMSPVISPAGDFAETIKKK